MDTEIAIIIIYVIIGLLVSYKLLKTEIRKDRKKYSLSGFRGTTSESFPIDFSKELKCLDCGSTEFLSGPEGGSCMNIKCSNCGSEYNLEQVTMSAHRIEE